MKQKIENIGEGEGAVFTLGFYNEDFSLHYSSMSFPIAELPEGAQVNDVYEPLKTGRIETKAFDWIPI